MPATPSFQAIEGQFSIGFSNLGELPQTISLHDIGLQFPDEVDVTADSASSLTRQAFDVPGGKGSILGVREAAGDLQIAITVTNASPPLEIQFPLKAGLTSAGRPLVQAVPPTSVNTGPDWSTVLEFPGAGATIADHGLRLSLIGWQARLRDKSLAIPVPRGC